MVMLALRLPEEIEERLNALAEKTGRTKSFYAREAILRHLEDLEALAIAEQRARDDDGTRFTMDDMLSDLEEDRAKAVDTHPAE